MNLKKSKTVSKFLAYYPNPGTKFTYTSALNKFFAAIKVDPDKYFETNRDYETDLRFFADSIKTLCPKTFWNYIVAIKMFYLRNEVIVNPLVFRDFKMIKRSRKPVTRDRIPTNKEIKLLLAHADLRLKALILTLLSSGARIGELLQVQVSDVSFDEEPVKIYIRGKFTKTGEARVIFISDEATVYLQEFIKQRDNYLQYRSKIHFTDRQPKTEDDGRLFPFSKSSAHSSFVRLLRLAGIDNRDPESKKRIVHIHGFRKYFRTKMALSMPLDIVEILMGHQGYLSGSYVRYTEAELSSYYLDAMSSVTIFGKDYSKELQELEQEIKRRDEKIDSIEKRLGSVDQFAEAVDDLKKIHKKYPHLFKLEGEK